VNAHGIVDWGMPEEKEKMKDFTDAEWVETQTLDKDENWTWEPQGELIILPGSKPIDIDAIQAKARLIRGERSDIKIIEYKAETQEEYMKRTLNLKEKYESDD
jgi:hypothetical protein